jgi:serine/threonine protein kinase
MKQGLSGCKLELLENGLVRKTSKDWKYNNRLYNQMLKQIQFGGLNSNTTHIPRVVKSGHDSIGLFYFDMEQVKGVPLSEILDTLEPVDYEYVCNIIQNFISACARNVQPMKVNIVETTNTKLGEDIDIGVNEWLSETLCHGDFTLDNIFFDKATRKIGIIDFLDSYINHYYLDIAFLYQIESKLPLPEDTKYHKYHNYLLYSKFKRMLPYNNEQWVKDKVEFYKEKLK